MERRSITIENATILLAAESDGNIHIHINDGKVEKEDHYVKQKDGLYFRLGEPRFSGLDCKFFKFGYIDEETREFLGVK